MADLAVPTRPARLARALARRRAGTLALTSGLLAVVAAGGCRQSAPASPDGAVVVAAALPGGAAAAAGLRAGDRLFAFARPAAPPANPEPADGPLASCLDVARVEIEESPRGPVELEIERDGRRSTVEVRADDWRLGCRPERPTTPAGKVLDRLGRAVAAADRGEGAPESDLDAAVAAAAADPPLLSYALLRRAEVRLAIEHFDDARADLEQAIAILRRRAPKSLELARVLALLARIENQRQDLEAADKPLAEALDVQSRQAPESLALAATLNIQANLRSLRGDDEGALPIYRRALALAEARLPEGRLAGNLHKNLGSIARRAGRNDEAERHANRAMAILDRTDPGSIAASDVRLNLGTVASQRGDLDRAERLYREALAVYERRLPGSIPVAVALLNLGLLGLDRGDYDLAAEQIERARTLFEKLRPNSPTLARTLTNLATVHIARNDFARAEGYARRAIEIHRKQAPKSPILAYDLIDLAKIAASRGDRAAAHAHLAEATRIAAELQATAETAFTFESATEIYLAIGDPTRAATMVERALSVFGRLTPGSPHHVASLALRGRIERLRGRKAAALSNYAQVLELLDRATARLGGSDLDRTRFRALYAEVYRDAIELELARGDQAGAFHTLERFRARGLLDLIAARDLAPPAELPASLAQEQRRIDADLGRVSGVLEGIDLEAGRVRLDALLAERARLLAERTSLGERIRRAAPRYAALTAPVPLDLAAARATLDPGTIWLAYVLGDSSSTLFVVVPPGFPGAPPSGLAVRSIPAGRAALETDVALLRSLALAGAKGGSPAPFRAAAERLAETLLTPALPWLEAAERIVISPDGALAALPFAALGLPGPAQGYLVERWPISTVVSATLAAELRRSGGSGLLGVLGKAPLVAFGDPARPAIAQGEPPELPAARTADARRAGPPWIRFRAGLVPLPGSRAEVAALAALVRPAVVRLGAEATEARFLADAPAGRIVHFAGHALLDPRFPLDSGLALAPPARAARPGDDGLLQAWEVFERLRLRADLVTLSACETGLGPEAQGEGLLGLTRAFHYAGARTVLASLWSVSDRSTSDLMRRFYGHLERGEPKDRALALAQRELISSGPSHPYFWAAFELDGDARSVDRGTR